MPLSVLDLAPVGEGSTPGQALRSSLVLAAEAERLGYRRYWVAEHHNMPGIASSSPPVLLAHAAGVTETIRLGSGGVMLPNHASLVVAEQFGMLEALHPGRIDLGIGRAPGTDQLTARALRRSPGALAVDDFPEQLVELMGYFSGEFPEGHPYAAHHGGAGPRPPARPSGCSGRATTAPRRPGCSACRSRSPTTSPRPTPSRRCRPTGPSFRPVGRPRRALRDARRVGASARRRDDEAEWLAGLGGAGVPAAAVGPARPLPDARGSGRVPVHPARARGDQGVDVLAHRRRPAVGAGGARRPGRRGPAPTS